MKRIYILWLTAAFWMVMWGCVMAPKTLKVTDVSEAFEQGTIISGETGSPVSFEALTSTLSQARIVYVGERHTNSEHHKIQLQIIQALYRKNPNLSVGMEMFDFTYQSVLDEWRQGKIDEAFFLKNVHWYANWKYPFRLYRDILMFIKENNIPLFGLNIPFHLPAKIGIGGIDSLSDIEKKYLPQDIDTSIEAHKTYVKEVFDHHGQHMKGRRDFESFYQAQCAWDDGMAESIARHIGDTNMVVLAGNGHIYRKFGIPERAYRRTQLAYKTVYLAPVDTEATLADGDFIWVTGTLKKPKRHFTKS